MTDPLSLPMVAGSTEDIGFEFPSDGQRPRESGELRRERMFYSDDDRAPVAAMIERRYMMVSAIAVDTMWKSTKVGEGSCAQA